jgi:hypothetical protein
MSPQQIVPCGPQSSYRAVTGKARLSAVLARSAKRDVAIQKTSTNALKYSKF